MESGFSEIVGIYHANGSLIGEIAYVVGKVFGRAHCALCDITHGWSPKERSDFTSCRAQLGVPWRAVHLDERDTELTAFTDGKTPCVVGRHRTGRWVLLLDPVALEACSGQPKQLVDRLVERMGEVERE